MVPWSQPLNCIPHRRIRREADFPALFRQLSTNRFILSKVVPDTVRFRDGAKGCLLPAIEEKDSVVVRPRRAQSYKPEIDTLRSRRGGKEAFADKNFETS